MMSWVVGLDLSTHAIDAVYLEEDGLHPPVHIRTPLEGRDSFERARYAGSRAINDVDLDDVLAIGIEDPRGYGAGHIYRVQGAALARIPLHILVQPWIPSVWRKAVGVAGNASKTQIQEWAVGHGAPPDWKYQDAYDAYGIAVATMNAIERTE